MEMRGEINRLHFAGQVQTVSTEGPREHHSMACDALTVTFVDLPEPQTIQPEAMRERGTYWVYTPLVRLLAGRDESRRTSVQFNKRPVLVLADGSTVAVSSTHHPESRVLLSRMRINGPRVAIDLRRQTTNVEGAGNLLIEDYRLRTRDRSPRQGDSDALLGDLGGGGPSQTLFTWGNSMSYLQDRNIAIFDKDVHMVHRAGSKMVLGTQVAAARSLDVQQLRRLSGRSSTLDCRNLLVEFARRSSERKDGDSPYGAAELRQLDATGEVQLKDSNKSLVGDRLTYFSGSGMITIRAARGREAHIYDENARSDWRGPVLRWNRKTDRVEAADATMVFSRK